MSDNMSAGVAAQDRHLGVISGTRRRTVINEETFERNAVQLRILFYHEKKREKEFQILALIIYLFLSESTHLPLDHDGRLTDGLGDFNQGTVTGFPLRRLFLQEKAAGIGTQFVIVV